MAFLPNQFDEEDDKQKQQQEQQQEGAETIQQIGGGSSALGGGDTQEDTIQDSEEQSTGSGFTNINRYLEQNQNQSDKMVSGITDKITTTGDSAASSIDDASNVFNTQATEQEVAYDPTKYIQNGTGTNTQDIFTQSDDIAAEEGRFNELQAQRDAQYTGATDFREAGLYQPTKENVDKANTIANQTLTDEGRKDLLTDFNRNRVSDGMFSLDNLLLGSDTNKGKLSEARDYVTGMSLEDRLTQADEAAKARAQEVTDLNEATRQQTGQDLSGATDTFKDTVNQRTQDAIKKANETFERAKQQVQSGNITQDVADYLGLDADAIESLKQKASGFGNFSGLKDLNAIRNIAANPRDKFDVSGTLGPVKDFLNFMNPNKNNYVYNETLTNAAVDAARRYNTQAQAAQDAFNVDNYLSRTDPTLTNNRHNISTQEDYARQDALSKLMGENVDYLHNKELAGTANLNTSNLDNHNLENFYDTYIKELASTGSKLNDAVYDARTYAEPISTSDMYKNMAEPVTDIGKSVFKDAVNKLKKAPSNAVKSSVKHLVKNPVKSVKKTFKKWSDVNAKTNINRMNLDEVFEDIYNKKKEK